MNHGVRLGLLERIFGGFARGYGVIVRQEGVISRWEGMTDWKLGLKNQLALNQKSMLMQISKPL